MVKRVVWQYDATTAEEYSLIVLPEVKSITTMNPVSPSSNPPINDSAPESGLSTIHTSDTSSNDITVTVNGAGIVVGSGVSDGVAEEDVFISSVEAGGVRVDTFRHGQYEYDSEMDDREAFLYNDNITVQNKSVLAETGTTYKASIKDTVPHQASVNEIVLNDVSNAIDTTNTNLSLIHICRCRRAI